MDKDKPDTWSAVAKLAYTDTLQPAAQEIGKAMALPFRGLNALLSGCYKYVMNAEENMKETEKLLAQKLANFKPEQIQAPDPYVAVPALQALSYVNGEKVLREMFANLLAASMIKGQRQLVHPAYVHFVSQMSSDDAKILKYIYDNKTSIATLTMRYENSAGSGQDVVTDFTSLYVDVPNLAQRHPNDTAVSIDNLSRLQLVFKNKLGKLTDDSLYDRLYADPLLVRAREIHEQQPGFIWRQERNFVNITSLGMAFCRVCLSESV